MQSPQTAGAENPGRGRRGLSGRPRHPAMTDWFAAPLPDLLAAALSAAGVYAAVILLTQAFGLRSFSKMSGFDFAITVAIGSVVASTALTPSPPLLQAVVALATLYALQAAVAVLRQKSAWASRWVDNEPLLIMTSEGILRGNLRRVRMTEADLWSKLREAGVLDPASVRAVVMETTGDVSVLAGEGRLDARLLSGVRDAGRVPGLADADVPDAHGEPLA